MAFQVPTRGFSQESLPDGQGSVNYFLGNALPPPFQLITPWETLNQNSFFTSVDIQGDRWNLIKKKQLRLYPYRLLVVQQNEDGITYSIVCSGQGKPTLSVQSQGPGRWQISFQPTESQWVYQLPITPQQLSIQTMFTAQATATLNGITEESGGIRFKMLSVEGTVGMWPYRPNIDSKLQTPSTGLAAEANAFFAGTLSQANALVNQVKRTINTAISGHPSSPPTVIPPEDEGSAGIAGTGYAQILILDQFLEQYSEAKKNPSNKSWRLAFDIPKQNQTFLVSPTQFRYFQSVDSPLEYKFSLQLKAWKRVALSDPAGSEQEAGSLALTSSILQRALNAINETQKTLSVAYNVIGAVRSDVATVFDGLRTISVICKQALGLPFALTDLPSAIAQDWKNIVSDSFNSIDFTTIKNANQQNYLRSLQNQSIQNEGLSFGAVSLNQLGATSANHLATDPSNDPFQNPDGNADLFGLINIADLNLNTQQQNQLDNYLDSVTLLDVDDLIQICNNLIILSYQLGNLFNAGNNQYNTTYDKAPKFVRGYNTTLEEIGILNSVYDSIQAIQSITATNQLDQQDQNSAMDFVKALADQGDAPFEVSASKVRVPVPYNLTMEQIAARYLNNPQRWIEIATLNSLREPYIDETGFIVPLISNAIGRQFNVASNDNLYIKQKIYLSGTGIPLQVRTIIDIEEIAANNYLITVDGLSDLDIFTTIADSEFKAYLPGTVNSQDQIYIPSELPPPDNLATRPIPQAQNDVLTQLSGVDLLLDDNLDIVIDSQGDFKLSYGLTNLIQALKLKLSTTQGTMIQHPNFGAGVQVGTSSADTNADEIYKIITETVLSDPRFSGIQKLQVNIDGPVLAITLSVIIAGNQGVFPIAFTV